jgi:hypothetical protein
MMDDYVSESDSDYTSYWRDWVSASSIYAHAPWISIGARYRRIVMFR